MALCRKVSDMSHLTALFINCKSASINDFKTFINTKSEKKTSELSYELDKLDLNEQ